MSLSDLASSYLNPIQHLWRDIKLSAHPQFPSAFPELERMCRKEWQKIMKTKVRKAFCLILKQIGRMLLPKILFYCL